MREIKGPEDVKITEAVPWPVKPGLILPYDYIAIEEVGQIIEIVRSDTQVQRKLLVNENREWTDWRKAKPGKAIEHKRGKL